MCTPFGRPRSRTRTGPLQLRRSRRTSTALLSPDSSLVSAVCNMYNSADGLPAAGAAGGLSEPPCIAKKVAAPPTTASRAVTPAAHAQAGAPRAFLLPLARLGQVSSRAAAGGASSKANLPSLPGGGDASGATPPRPAQPSSQPGPTRRDGTDPSRLAEQFPAAAPTESPPQATESEVRSSSPSAGRPVRQLPQQFRPTRFAQVRLLEQHVVAVVVLVPQPLAADLQGATATRRSAAGESGPRRCCTSLPRCAADAGNGWPTSPDFGRQRRHPHAVVVDQLQRQRVRRRTRHQQDVAVLQVAVADLRRPQNFAIFAHNWNSASSMAGLSSSGATNWLSVSPSTHCILRTDTTVRARGCPAPDN